MKSVTLPEYQGNIIRALRSLQLVEKEIPALEADEVLVKINAAPCNPSDLAFIQGGYNVRKELPAIPGFEGTGTVIDSGSSTEAASLNGKRVSFFSQSDRGGSWASHIAVKAIDCIAISDSMPNEQAACFSVNPFTAYAMIEIAKAHNCKGIIQNAAGGQVANFINALAEIEGIEVINIVRKEEQVELLRKSGFKYIFWHLDEDFQSKITEASRTLDARIAYDAVGGDQSGFILQAMPENSTLYLYGALGSRTLSEIPATDVIFKNKVVRGFNMNVWKDSLSNDEFNKISIELQQLFINKTLHTEIQGSYKLEEYRDALMQYIRNMSGGKVLLLP
jgi:NADPH2:quinone reductase